MRGTGLRPHTAKTVVAPPGARKVVLGLLVDRDFPRLSREFKSRMRQHFYFVDKYGPDAHARERNFDSVWGLKNHLRGILSYAHQVEPEFVKSYFTASIRSTGPTSLLEGLQSRFGNHFGTKWLFSREDYRRHGSSKFLVKRLSRFLATDCDEAPSFNSG